MLRELITWVLNTYLGKYIEDFNPAQLSVALLSGEVELENVPIRRDALKDFGIPIQVLSGVIGKITLRIPIYQFKTAPWCITVEHVYVVLGPKDVNDWDSQEEKNSDLEVKMRELNKSEALWRAEKGYNNESFYYTTSYINWLNYGSSIATNILDNLELKVDHVHFRYEDLLTVPNNHFAFGLKIASLTIQSTDCDWNSSPKGLREDEYAYKLVQLNKFAVYADQIGVNNICGTLKSDELLERMRTFCCAGGHKFLLTPVSVSGQIKRQRSQPSSRKKFRRQLSCNVLVSEIKAVVNEDQYKQIIGCYAGLQEVNLMRSFKMFRPDKSIFENACVWWRYAARCNGYTFETQGEKWEKLKENLRYISVYKRFLLNSVISGEEKEFKSFVERKRPLFELETLRNICFNNIASNTNIDISQHPNHGKSMLFHWFPNWWGWYGNTSSDVVELNPKVDVDELQNIENKILNVIEDAIENNSYLKKELSFGNFGMELSIGQIFIFIESTSMVDMSNTMVEISIKGVNTIFETRSRLESCLIKLSIESINVRDYITPDTKFADLIRSHKKEYASLSPVLYPAYLPVCNFNSNSEKFGSWLHIQFERKPIGFNTDVWFSMKCRSLDIIYNATVFKWLVDFITSQQNGNNYRSLLNNRKEIKRNFPRKWRKFIFGSLEDRNTWSFELDIAANHIIFIEDPSDKNSLMLSVEFGQCQIFKGSRVEETNLNVKADGLNIKNVIEQLNTDVDYDADSDMFLTPCSTPPVSASSYPESPEGNFANPMLSKNNEIKFENSLRDKLYDKYAITLRDFQIILKQNVDGSSSISESSIFQFIDKFNFSIEFEMRKIHTTDQGYPLFTLLVTVPNLVIHIDDKYLSSFFNIASSAFPTNMRDENQQQTISFLNDYVGRYSLGHLCHFLIDFKIDKLILELQSKQQSLVELQTTGIGVRLTKEFDKTNLNLSILGVLLVDAIQCYGPDFELLFACHNAVSMDSSSGCLTQSIHCPVTRPQYSTFSMTRKPDLCSEMSSNTIGKQDQTQPYIMVDVEYINDNNESNYLPIIKMSLNSLHMVANHETIGRLVDFVKTLMDIYRFNTQNSIPKPQLQVLCRQRPAEVTLNFQSLNVLVLSTVKVPNSSFGKKVCTLTMNAAKTHISVNEKLSVIGTLGGFQIWDLWSCDSYSRQIIYFGRDRLTNDSNPMKADLVIPCTKQIFGYIKSKHEKMEKALLFKIVQNTFEENSTLVMKIRMTPVWYTHHNEFLEEITKSVKQYKRIIEDIMTYKRCFMKTIQKHATDVTDSHELKQIDDQYEVRTRKDKKRDYIIQFDIALRSSVVVIPDFKGSTDVLVANLGNIFLNTDKQESTHLTSGLTSFAPIDRSSFKSFQKHKVKFIDMSMYSSHISNQKDSLRAQQKIDDLYSNISAVICHKVTLCFDVLNYIEKKDTEGELDNCRNFAIEGKFVEGLELSLTSKQYQHVLESIKNFCNTTIHKTKYDTNSLHTFQNTSKNTNIPRNSLKEDYEGWAINIKIKLSSPKLILTLKNETNMPLFVIVIRDIVTTYNLRNNVHTEIKAVLRSVLMEDLQWDINSKFRYIAHSGNHQKVRKNEGSLIPSRGALKLTNSNLKEKMKNSKKMLKLADVTGNNIGEHTESIFLTINVNKIRPKLVSVSDVSYNNTIMIDTGSLHFLMSLKKWLYILNFFIPRELFQDNDKCNNYFKADEEKSLSREKSLFEFHMKTLDIIFIREDTLYVEANVSAVTFVLDQEKDTERVTGTIGSISLIDLCKFGELYRKKLVTFGNETFKFFYMRPKFRQNEACQENEATLNVKFPSICYVHTTRFFTNISNFLREFNASITQRLLNIEPGAAISPMRCGIQMEAIHSVILFPVHSESADLIIINLEGATLTNTFQNSDDETIKKKERYATLDRKVIKVSQIDLMGPSLLTGKLIFKGRKAKNRIELDPYFDFGSYYVARCDEGIFKNKLSLKFQIESNLDSNTFYVYGEVAQIACVLSPRQIKMIRGSITYNLRENLRDFKLESAMKKNSVEDAPSSDIALSVHVNFERIMLNLVLDEKDDRDQSSIARISFTSLLVVNFHSDNASHIEFAATKILVHDSRRSFEANSKKKGINFTDIIKPIGNDINSIQIQIHSKHNNYNNYNIFVKNIRILAILDWMEVIRRYFSEYIVLLPTQTNNNLDRDLHNGTANCLSFEFIINIIDSEIIFIENQSQTDTGAIVLKSSMIFSYKPQVPDRPISVSINHLEVFSCIYKFENESALSIIDPISLDIELRDNKLDVNLPKQVYIRLSYYDVKLILRLLSLISTQISLTNWKTLSKKSTDTNFEEIAPLVAMGFKTSDCFHAMEMFNNEINDAAAWLTHKLQSDINTKWIQVHAIHISGRNISVCVIDDCKDSDVPLLEILLSSSSLLLKLKEKTYSSQNIISGNLETTIGIDYYNRRLSGWEPMIEPWECITTWKYNLEGFISEDTFIEFQIKSNQLLKINVTNTLVELFKLVRANWTQEYYQDVSHVCENNSRINIPAYRLRTPFVPFALKNQTGEMLQFKTIIGQPGGLLQLDIIHKDFVNDWINVEPGMTVSFICEPQNKLRHSDSHKLNHHQIFVAIAGWTSVGPISIDKVGVFFRYSTEEELLRRSRIVFDISLIGSAQKLITVRSAIQVVNKLSFSIFLNTRQLKEQSILLNPEDVFNMPLKKIGSPVYVYPNLVGENEQTLLDSSIYKDGITWWTCINDMEELFISRNHKGSLMYILAVIKRDKYPKISRMPGHTISLITPLIVTNLLCSEIIFKTCANSEGCIRPSESENIYNIDIRETFHISFYLDNYNISGKLRIPENLSGVVEPKLKMVDIYNRELYLRATIQFMKGNGMEIFISAPVWIVNKTGLPLIYKQESAELETLGQFSEHESARNILPLMFSFSDPNAPACMQIRLGKRCGSNNPWCRSFDLCKDVIHRQLEAGDENDTHNYEIGVSIRKGRGRYSYTKIVTVSPWYQIYNRSSHELQFAQKCDTLSDERPNINIFTAIRGCNFSFHWPHIDADPLLCVRLQDVEGSQWSSGVPINEIRSVYINIRNELEEMHFLRLEVILHESSKYLLFTDAHALPPPIRINNYSDVQITFSQQGCKPLWVTSVRPHSTLAYVLDDPTGSNAIQIEAPGGRSMCFPLQTVENSRCFSYSNFLYIAFKKTFSATQGLNDINKPTVSAENRDLVLGVKDNKIIVMKKCTGDRSQLWLLNSYGQLEHEGTSPPLDQERDSTKTPRMVLDLERTPNPTEYTNLVLRPPNKQRKTTQTWRLEKERLKCHANMCVQVRNGISGLYSGAEAVVGLINSESRTLDNNWIPAEECIELQKLRPGSGYLEITSKMNGPTFTIQIRDLKLRVKDVSLTPDPRWKDITDSVVPLDTTMEKLFYKISIKFDFARGLGLSIISRYEELIFLTLERFIVDYTNSSKIKTLNVRVSEIQIDNQLLDTCCPVLLYTKLNTDDCDCLILNTKILPSFNENTVIVENLIVNFQSCTVILEECLLLKLALFLGLGKSNSFADSIDMEYDTQCVERQIPSSRSRRYYIESLYIGPFQIRLSLFTASKLSYQLSEVKKLLGLTFITFEDALIEFEKLSEKHLFEAMNTYFTIIRLHYQNQIKSHAASILGSVDFLGNPLGFANDLSEGVSGLIYEGSFRSLVRNITHGVSNSTAKLTESLSHSIGKVALDEKDNEARQKILEISSASGTSVRHLTAGLKGFGFGILGGMTSIVRHTYAGMQSGQGFHGIITGFGRGLIGTVAKPIIGMLDLTSETATALKETSKGLNRSLRDRKRLPRCTTGSPADLLPTYSYRQAQGQLYLYMINRRNFNERLIFFEPNLCNDRELSLLVSTEFIRIISRSDADPIIILDYHLSEVLSCHTLISNMENFVTSHKPNAMYCIEISTNLPKITRPRIKCQNEATAKKASRYINYAKTIFDEKEQTLVNESTIYSPN